MILEFDGLQAFGEACRMAQKTGAIDSYHADSAWAGDRTENASLCIDRIFKGNDTLVKEAEKVMDKLSVNLETPERQVQPSPFGGRFVIPELLADYPLSARRMIMTESEGAPVRVYVGIVYSGGFGHEELIARGTAILAMVMMLQMQRPVELILFTEMHGRDDGKTLFKINVGTAPLSLAHACHVLTSVRFTRGVIYSMGTHLNGFNGHWCNGHTGAGDSLRDPHNPYIKQLKEWLGAGENDIVIPGAFIDDPLMKDPVAYVQQTVNHLLGIEEFKPKAPPPPTPPPKRSNFKRRGSRGW